MRLQEEKIGLMFVWVICRCEIKTGTYNVDGVVLCGEPSHTFLGLCFANTPDSLVDFKAIIRG